MDVKHLLKDHAYQNIPLNFDEAYGLAQYALAGCRGDTVAQIQSIAALSALHTKATYAWQRTPEAERLHGHALPANAAEQIAGVCAAIFEHDIARSEFGFLKPKGVPFVMDNCGMGGDLTVTANVSTLAALIASAGGIKMCKHGSPANADTGRHGSSDFVSLLGIDTLASKGAVERCIETCGFGYTEALDHRYKQIHTQTHEVAHLPHMNDLIGPITNPLSPDVLSKRVLGVNHLVSPRIVAEAYALLNDCGITRLDHGWFVRGYADTERYAGMDEVSICSGGTHVAELRLGEIREFSLSAEDFGIDPVSCTQVSPRAGMSKGAFSLGILTGETDGPALRMVLANAAVLFHLAGHAASLREAYRVAQDVHERRLDLQKVHEVREFLPG